MSGVGDADTGWAVVETKPNAETVAERSLVRLGFEPYVPRYNKLIKGCRIEPNGRRVRSRENTVQSRPFLPGYLFVPVPYGSDAMTADTDHGWGKPLGVRRVLRHRMDQDGRCKPRIIRASIVEGIRLAALEKDETPRQVRADLKERMDSGQPVRVRHPLGFVATLVSLDDKGRARYFAELFGGEISGSFDNTDELELVAS